MVKCVLVITSLTCPHCVNWRGSGSLLSEPNKTFIGPGNHKYNVKFFLDLITGKGQLNDNWTALSAHVVPKVINGRVTYSDWDILEFCEYALYQYETKNGIENGIKQRIFYPHNITKKTLLRERIYNGEQDISTDTGIYDQGESWNDTIKAVLPPTTQLNKFIRHLPAILYYDLEPQPRKIFYAASWGLKVSKKFPFMYVPLNKNGNIDIDPLEQLLQLDETKEYICDNIHDIELVRDCLED